MCNDGFYCRGDITVKRDSRMDSCSFESEADTEEDEETDGTRLHAFLKPLKSPFDENCVF